MIENLKWYRIKLLCFWDFFICRWVDFYYYLCLFWGFVCVWCEIVFNYCVSWWIDKVILVSGVSKGGVFCFVKVII